MRILAEVVVVVGVEVVVVLSGQQLLGPACDRPFWWFATNP